MLTGEASGWLGIALLGGVRTAAAELCLSY